MEGMAIHQSLTLSLVGVWRWRDAIEGVAIRIGNELVGYAGCLDKRGSSFVVGDVRLSRVGEKGENSSDFLRGGGFAC